MRELSSQRWNGFQGAFHSLAFILTTNLYCFYIRHCNRALRRWNITYFKNGFGQAVLQSSVWQLGLLQECQTTDRISTPSVTYTLWLWYSCRAVICWRLNWSQGNAAGEVQWTEFAEPCDMRKSHVALTGRNHWFPYPIFKIIWHKRPRFIEVFNCFYLFSRFKI